MKNMIADNKMAFWFSLILGLLVWVFSKPLTGRAEPWDGNTTYYAMAIFFAGLVYGLMCKNRPWLGYISVYLGQFLYGFSAFMICMVGYCPGGANLFPIGAIFLLITTIPALPGAFVGWLIIKCFRKYKKTPQ